MIPKIIHFCWLSDEEYPIITKKCIESWKSNLTGYEFILWDTKKFNIDSTLWTKEAFENKKYAFVSDYIRLYAIYNYGGIYLDTDAEVLKNFDDLLKLPYFIGTQWNDLIESAIFGAEKQSDWVLDCLNYYDNRSFINTDGSLDMIVLPIIMQSQIEKNKKIIKLKSNQVHNIYKLVEDKSLFYLYPNEYFSPKNYLTGKTFKSKKTYTIHHYNNSWKSFQSIQKLKLIRLLGPNKAEKIISIFKIRKLIALLKKL